MLYRRCAGMISGLILPLIGDLIVHELNWYSSTWDNDQRATYPRPCLIVMTVIYRALCQDEMIAVLCIPETYDKGHMAP
jgi:hypothetical protein